MVSVSRVSVEPSHRMPGSRVDSAAPMPPEAARAMVRAPVRVTAEEILRR